MTNAVVIAISIKLISGFIAALVSVMLWSKTRDAAWLLMVVGVVFLYIETLMKILDAFGFILYRDVEVRGLAPLPLIFEVMPFIFFATGMFLFLLRIRKF